MTDRAIIGGTGFLELSSLVIVNEHSVSTPFGDPSSLIYEVTLNNSNWFVLLRHGNPHEIAPHNINYRANIWALKSLNISKIIAVNAVGGIHKEAYEGRLVLPDQLIDYTSARKHTFYDRQCLAQHEINEVNRYLLALEHIEFENPFSTSLRQEVLAVSTKKNLDLWSQGVCAVTQGPRLETAAEIKRLHNDGCDIVGMTLMPEAGLAKELGLEYASLAMVVNKAAGLSDEPITIDRIHTIADQCMSNILSILIDM